MPPKASSKAGRTKKQSEADELAEMQQLAMDMFDAARAGPVSVGKRGGHINPTDLLGKRKKPTAEDLQQMLAARQQEEAAMIARSVYVNVSQPLPDASLLHWTELASGKWIRFSQFSDDDMCDIVALFTAELSEPYSAFTFEHFLGGWSDLGILVHGAESATAPEPATKGSLIGCIVSKISRKGPGHPLKGYIAMLAVTKSFRGHKIGQKLVRVTVELMQAKGCDEVGLETPVTNQRALSLYLDLGFAKTKYLTRYYLDGSDAVRLKLWTRDPTKP